MYGRSTKSTGPTNPSGLVGITSSSMTYMCFATFWYCVMLFAVLSFSEAVSTQSLIGVDRS